VRVNEDDTQAALVHSASLTWSPTETDGTFERILSDSGQSGGASTRIVRLLAGWRQDPHIHDSDLEYLVLEGVYETDTGIHPKGTYVRQPAYTKHSLAIHRDSILFIKRGQQSGTGPQVTCTLQSITPIDRPGQPNIRVWTLYQSDDEDVRIEQWAPGSALQRRNQGGIEILVLSGGFLYGSDALTQYSWLRLPHGHDLDVQAGDRGALAWIKTGHL